MSPRTLSATPAALATLRTLAGRLAARRRAIADAEAARFAAVPY